MNLPNKITITRILLIPLFLVIVLVDFNWGNMVLFGAEMPVNQFVGALIFIIASTTDWIDGHYARKHNLVTNFGKFLDPLADKLIVLGVLIMLIPLGRVPAWGVFLILAREFAVTGLRLVLAGEGKVVAASKLGKIKTWTQIVAICSLLLNNTIFTLIDFRFDQVALWIALFFTILSGWDYFQKNWHAFKETK